MLAAKPTLTDTSFNHAVSTILSGDKLLTMLLRHHSGQRVWSVLHEPTPEDEDARRTHREQVRLMHERTAHTNRISSLLVLHNLRQRTQWFNRRFAAGDKRMRRIGIVALTRRLAIALWRYLQHGEIPAGATLKPA